MADASDGPAATAIDIALEPNQTMVVRAHADNATLLQSFPQGFALDETHHAHTSLFAGFVPTADLPEVYALAAGVLAKEPYPSWKLTAFKYYYVPMGPIGLAGIVIHPTPDLLRLQRKLIEAVGPLMVKSATAAAFFTTPTEPDIHEAVIDYIARSSEANTGESYSPHVTIGLASTAFLDDLLSKPFDEFTFSPVSASVYQFGDFGTARKRLKALLAPG
jgi:hypothetical protein